MKTLIVAPHPDDETLGCGGTLLRRKREGGEIAWLIVTRSSEKLGWSSEMLEERKKEIEKVAELISFDQVFNLREPSAELDQMPLSELIDKISSVFSEFQPSEVFLPHPSDAHTDHKIVFDATTACTKWFRYPSVKRVLTYETLSETEFGLNPEYSFKPNLFVDISEFLEQKLNIISTYKSEMASFPFPRSIEAIRALAKFRGSSSGFLAAEAFQLLRERE